MCVLRIIHIICIIISLLLLLNARRTDGKSYGFKKDCSETATGMQDERGTETRQPPLSNSSAMGFASVRDSFVVDGGIALNAHVEINEGNLIWGFGCKYIGIDGLWVKNGVFYNYRCK